MGDAARLQEPVFVSACMSRMAHPIPAKRPLVAVVSSARALGQTPA